MNTKTLFTLVLLTFIGMVGIYIGAAYAYKRYEDYKAQTGSVSGAVGLLGSLLGTSH